MVSLTVFSPTAQSQTAPQRLGLHGVVQVEVKKKKNTVKS